MQTRLDSNGYVILTKDTSIKNTRRTAMNFSSSLPVKDIFYKKISFAGTPQDDFFKEIQKDKINEPELSKYIISIEFDPNKKDRYTGKTAMHYIAEKGWTQGITILLRKSSTTKNNSKYSLVNGTDYEGKTPLHLAKNEETIRKLLQNEADVSIRDNNGKIPAEYNKDIIRIYNEEFKTSKKLSDFVNGINKNNLLGEFIEKVPSKKLLSSNPYENTREQLDKYKEEFVKAQEDLKPKTMEELLRARPDLDIFDRFTNKKAEAKAPPDQFESRSTSTPEEIKRPFGSPLPEGTKIPVSDTQFSVFDALGSEQPKVSEDKPKVSKVGKISPQNVKDTRSFDTAIKRKEFTDSDPKGFCDVAGMSYIKDELYSSVVLPLSQEIQEKFKENKINMLNGVLLYGPSGNGKTFIIESLAEETKLPFYLVDMSSIGSGVKNGTVEKLKAVYDQLEKKFKETGERSILFLDEFDAAAPNRENLGGNTSKVEEIDAILNLMNNCSYKGIITVAATNLKDNIDKAAKRPGRLDKHLFVGPPDFEARKDIITKTLKDRPIAKKIFEAKDGIDTISNILNGFSCAAIRYIAEETMRVGILNKKNSVSIEDVKEQITKYSKEQNIPESNEVNATSMYDTFKQREKIGENDPKCLEDIAGMSKVKEELLDAIIKPWNPKNIKKLKENNLPMPAGTLLYGPPGCGKTYIIKAIAGETKLPLYMLNLSKEGSSLIHETGKNIRALFDQLKEKYEKTGEPSILFIDECESLLINRDSIGSNAEYKREEINEILQLLNNSSQDGIILVGATNKYEQIDEAAARSGRFDTHVYVGLPDLDARQDQVKKLLAKMPIAKPVIESNEKVSQIAKALEGLAPADITNLIGKTARNAVLGDKQTVTVEDFLKDIEKFKQQKPSKKQNPFESILNSAIN